MMARSCKELAPLRKSLFDKITTADLKWTTFPLRYDLNQPLAQAPFTIEVCRAVSKDGYFVPVTADETFRLARQWGLFPLTSAVMDQVAYFYADGYLVPRMHMDNITQICDFVAYSEHLNRTMYATAVAMGAHKLWIISGEGMRINHGFHLKSYKSPHRPKFLGNRLAAIQVVGAQHEAQVEHWDYSQLLQFMRNFRNQKDGIQLDLRRAIEQRHPALWDEVEEKDKPPKRLP